ncbi:MAG TPA: FHA domain-containing protein [Woeseiaceae bacterium]|nr:FHA domain-containing protein [Woeseiaceae bacterium]
MELTAAGLRQQPFRTQGEPIIMVPCESHLAALDFCAATFADRNGLGLFEGPPLSGKSTILREFTRTLPENVAFAIVDGAGLETNALLKDALGQFGYEFEFNSTNELINMLKVFARQQAAAGHPPLLVIENTHAMSPAALSTLCDLVSLKIRDQSAFRFVLASDRSMAGMMKAPAMSCIAKRQTGRLELEPMSDFETRNYVYAKMRAGGCSVPARIFPEDVCLELHAASNGWPGVVERLVLLALSKAEKVPITSELILQPGTAADLSALRDVACDWAMDPEAPPPVLFVSYNGELLRELVLDRPRLLIGRSEHNELRISSRFVSRHHAMFVRHGAATFLMDLNSTNGTFVNSRRISNLMLRHEDVVQLGNHRIKFVDPSATERSTLDDSGLSETVVMKSLEDVRRLVDEQTAPVTPAAAEG